jgi:RNA polymerase sigma-54 factor
MRFETSQSMKMGQHMKLAPRMIQSMEILQMPLAELEERLEQELESNPTLELTEGDGEGGIVSPTGEDTQATHGSDADGKPEAGADEFERLDSFEESNPDIVENEYTESTPRERSREEDFDGLTYRKVRDSGGDRDAKMDAMAAAPARGASLLDQLRGQWSLADVDDAIRPYGELILSFLEDDGSLKTPLETIADRAPVAQRQSDVPARAPGGAISRNGVVQFATRPSVQQLEHALRALQLFLEPAGVAARSPQEALLLQLDALEAGGNELGWPLEAFAAAKTITAHHLDDLMQNRLPKVAEKTGLTLEQIKDAMTLLRRLSLAPGRRLVETNERPIVPDAIVEFDEATDRYFAYLNDAHLPSLRINEEYARLSRDKAMVKRDREFIKTNLGNAQWLLDAVNQRRQTLLRVVHKVIEHQRDFFDLGPQALKPLPMTQVAEELGIHVATVSRAVAEKYLATPRGVMPLRKFFSGGVARSAIVEEGETQPASGGEAGESLAWDAIKVALQEVIATEDKRNPLSDEALADELKKRGIAIARRTVAKYRDQLNIQSARLRKVY